MADKQNLWKLKVKAHDLMNRVFGGMNSAFGNRAAQYRWLQENSRTGHISSLKEHELEQVIKKLKRLL